MRIEAPTLQLPSRSQLAWWVVLTVGAGAFVLVSAVFGALLPPEPVGPRVPWLSMVTMLFSLPAALVALPMAWIGVRRERPDTSTIALGLGALTGAGAIFLDGCVLGVMSRHSLDPEVMLFVIPIGLIALLIGTPLGLVFSLPFLPLMRFGSAPIRALDQEQRTLRFCSGWLAIVSAASAGLLLLSILIRDALDSTPILVLLSACAAVALVSWSLYVDLRRHGRHQRRWLEQVRAGEISGWAVLPLAPEPPEDELERPALFLDDEKLPRTGMLARQRPSADHGAYRTAAELEPVATVM